VKPFILIPFIMSFFNYPVHRLCFCGFSVLAGVCLLLFTQGVMAQTPITKELIFRSGKAPSVEDPAGNTLDIQKGQVYVFRLEGANSAYYDAQISAQQLSKNITLPASLQGFIPDGTAGVQPRSRFLVGVTGTFLQETKDEYLLLEGFVNESRQLFSDLSKVPDSLNEYHVKAAALMTSTAYALHVQLPGDSTDPKVMAKALEEKIYDFQSRVQLLKDNHGLQEDAAGIAVYNASALIGKYAAVIVGLPNTLYACETAKPYIDSKPYKMGRADYMAVHLTVYAGKFLDNKDSLLSKSFTYYRSRYFSFDVTSGFFYSNLASQSYYFTDSLGHYQRESKSKSDLSVGALLHFDYVFSPDFKAGLCGGGGVSLFDAKPKALIGAGMVIGRKREFALTGGCAISSIPAVSHALTNTGNSYVSSSEGVVPTYAKVTVGYFIGVTYGIVKF
jgi:hypothetical protein